MPVRMPTISESTFNVQKPPSPIGLVANVRWWVMYSLGLSYEAAMLDVFPSVFLFGVAHGDGRREHSHRDHEGREERNVHDVPVLREDQQESGEDQDDLDAFGPEHRRERLPGRPRFAARDPPTVDPTRHDVDRSPEGGGKRAVPSPKEC